MGLLARALHNHLVGVLLVLAGLQAQSNLTPGGNRSRHTNGALALAAAVRVVAGVHDNTADRRADAHVTGAAGLTDADVLVIGVADGADGGHGVHGNLANFAGGQTNLSVLTFLSHELSAHTGGANHLAAAAGLDFHIVDQGTNGNVGDGQRVAGLDVGVGTGDDGLAHLNAQRSQDVALLAIGVVQQGDERAAVGIVLDGGNLGGDVQLVALEVWPLPSRLV